MSIIYAENVTFPSEIADTQDLPLDESIDETQYAHLMRRIGLVESEPGTPVSAFNSSI
jgi:hypothetical protein